MLLAINNVSTTSDVHIWNPSDTYFTQFTTFEYGIIRGGSDGYDWWCSLSRNHPRISFRYDMFRISESKSIHPHYPVRRTRQPSMFFRYVTDTNQRESHSGHQQLRFTRNYMGAWRTWRRPPTSSLLLDWSCKRTRRRKRVSGCQTIRTRFNFKRCLFKSVGCLL